MPIPNGIGNIRVDKGPISAADDLLAKTLVRNGQLGLPVNVEDLAQKIGLDISYEKLPLGTDGELVKDGPAAENGMGFKAIIDENGSRHRQRFTIAHEIGHYIHGYQDYPKDGKNQRIVEMRNVASSNGINQEEVWANTFASEILMPASIVTSLWGQGVSVRDMTRRFDVSTRVMGTWLDNLGLDGPDE